MWAQGDEPLSRYELTLYVSDKTQLREEGRFFYDGSGNLLVMRNGKCESGEWSTTETGAMCWHVSTWGELPCETYFGAGDEIRILRSGRMMPAPKLERGNTLDCPAVAGDMEAASLLTALEAEHGQASRKPGHGGQTFFQLPE